MISGCKRPAPKTIIRSGEEDLKNLTQLGSLTELPMNNTSNGKAGRFHRVCSYLSLFSSNGCFVSKEDVICRVSRKISVQGYIAWTFCVK